MTDAALKNKLEQLIDDPATGTTLYERIVNAPFRLNVEMALLFLGIIVLLIVDKQTGTINRVALSKTDLAEGTLKVSPMRFEEIRIPMDEPQNVIGLAIKKDKAYLTTDWKYLFVPTLTDRQARLNQAGGGIAYSCVYPLHAGNGGALIYSYFQFEGKIRPDQRQFMKTYSAIVDRRLEKNLRANI